MDILSRNIYVIYILQIYITMEQMNFVHGIPIGTAREMEFLENGHGELDMKKKMNEIYTQMFMSGDCHVEA